MTFVLACGVSGLCGFPCPGEIRDFCVSLWNDGQVLTFVLDYGIIVQIKLLCWNQW